MKIIFFDIDGTLISRNRIIPDTVRPAIENLRSNGNIAFISSGRTKILVRDPLLDGILFDGTISGCGSLIEYRGETVFYKKIPNDLATTAVNVFKKNKVLPIAEGKDFIYFDESNLNFAAYNPELKALLGEKLLPLEKNLGNLEISKFSCLTIPNVSNVADCVKNLGNHFDFQIHDETCFEMVTKNVNKGSAIKIVCEKLGIDISDTFAVGDSVNDFEMLKNAGTAIAMANAPEKVKSIADYVTDFAENDGIAKALRYFNLTN